MPEKFTSYVPQSCCQDSPSCLPLIPNSFEECEIWLKEIRDVEEES